MAWTVISDTVIEVGKAIRALDFRNLRDNITALANGDVGAPRIQTAALQDNAITWAKIAAGNVLQDKLGTGTGERDWVLARIASMTAGAVGTYIMGYHNTANTAISPGSTYAGSALRYLSFRESSGALGQLGSNGVGFSGTWMALSAASAAGSQNGIALFVRVA